MQALAPLGAIFGGPIGGWIADRWGRKSAMMFCGVPYLIGYMILSYAHFAPTATAFKGVLLTGRFISGMGMGWASTAVSVSIKLSVLYLTYIYMYVQYLLVSAVKGLPHCMVNHTHAHHEMDLFLIYRYTLARYHLQD